jgi:putative hydrolase of the HAD superfamily
MSARIAQTAENISRWDGIDCWIFDLDNCLYPAGLNFFREIDQRIAAYVRRVTGLDHEAAHALQKHYFHAHGTTLAGLMTHNGINPDDYLTDVHDVDMSALVPDPVLYARLAALPGRRHIYTNGDADYAWRVLDRRGIADLFDVMVDIRATDFIPKPQPAAYAMLGQQIVGFDPARSLFVDDMSRNLAPAHALGLTTVWLDNGSEAGNRDHDSAHVDHHIHDLTGWLDDVIASLTTQPEPTL